MVLVRNSLPARPHQLFQGVFAHWQTEAGALSALPDAPVVLDDARQPGPAWRWLQSRLGRCIDWP
ncbi:hypothetical protein [Streptomyces sp. NPDC050287]|uniref:hypothetical protein n=1 Tax=Streptomyces sp. NPDC050287 TaxID=3365608 RepID=UPI00378A0846